MRWILILLLAANVAFFAWHFPARLQGPVSEAPTAVPPPIGRLLLLSEVGPDPDALDGVPTAAPEIPPDAAPSPEARETERYALRSVPPVPGPPPEEASRGGDPGVMGGMPAAPSAGPVATALPDFQAPAPPRQPAPASTEPDARRTEAGAGAPPGPDASGAAAGDSVSAEPDSRRSAERAASLRETDTQGPAERTMASATSASSRPQDGSAVSAGPAAQRADEPVAAREGAAGPGAEPAASERSQPAPDAPGTAIAGISADASRRCYRIGPRPEEAGADPVVAWLEERGATVDLRSTIERNPRSYWVYLAPYGDADLARATVSRMLAEGVTDVMRIPTGPMTNAVSLGLYAREPVARKRLEAIRARGYEALLETRFDEIPQRWLDVTLAAETPLDTLALTQRFPGLAFEEGGCALAAEGSPP